MITIAARLAAVCLLFSCAGVLRFAPALSLLCVALAIALILAPCKDD